jgi:hypothetical protein
MALNKNPEYSQPYRKTTEPAVASSDPGATVEEPKLQLWIQVKEQAGDSIDTVHEAMRRLRGMQPDLTSLLDDAGLEVVDDGA